MAAAGHPDFAEALEMLTSVVALGDRTVKLWKVCPLVVHSDYLCQSVFTFTQLMKANEDSCIVRRKATEISTRLCALGKTNT